MGIENFRQAISALRSNWVRSLLTMLIIAFGIMAVVGILTAIDSAIYSINSNFSSIGANSITIRPKRSEMQGRHGGKVGKRAEPINYEQAIDFAEVYQNSATVALEMQVTGSGVVKYGEKETNPVGDVVGVNENYLRVKNFDIEVGRGLTAIEAKRGANVAIVGDKIIQVLFDGNPERALGKTITMGALRLEVIGTLVNNGSSMNDGADNIVALPLQTARRAYGTQQTRFNIYAELPISADIEAAVSVAEGQMRIVRGLSAQQENDFEIVTPDSLIETIREDTSKLQIGAVAIGVMTLLGAAIGLMNIMLVSVTERTREIGIAKALGASRSSILTQFLTEAVIVTQLGGVIGIIFGIVIGNVVALIAGGDFLIPWNWILLSFVVCLFTGLLSGLYPAVKASRLDPIESLRYE